MPRLSSFKKIAPHIDLRILASYELVDFAKTDITAAIRWGRGTFPGLVSTLLFHNELFPVCSPRLLKRRHPLEKPNDLRHYTLVHALSWSEGLTPLWAAAFRGDMEIVKAILATPEGLKTLHQPDKQGTTPLLIAAYRGHIELAKFLLVKSKEDRESFLQLFSSVPHLDLVEMIIANTHLLHSEEDDEVDEYIPTRVLRWSLLGMVANIGAVKLVRALLKTELGRSTIKLRLYFTICG